jgi:uncharacterized membrane protein
MKIKHESFKTWALFLMFINFIIGMMLDPYPAFTPIYEYELKYIMLGAIFIFGPVTIALLMDIVEHFNKEDEA